uniref:Uncharacterized protein n=1 Tax=Aegilops tauschii subsp. strangulata TaxID=200361 RepID=A0A453EGB9_AEGTS
MVNNVDCRDFLSAVEINTPCVSATFVGNLRNLRQIPAQFMPNNYVSILVQIISYIGGSLFLAFAAVTLVEIATS